MFLRFSVMQWADNIKRIRFIMITMAVVLSVASLVISHYLVRDLKHEEMVRMNIWAEAMRSFSDADSNADMSLVLKVLNSNATIPVKVLGRDGDVQMLRNMEDEADDLPYSVRIHLSESDWLDVYYDDSLLLRRLAMWPYIQFLVVTVFVLVAIYALRSSRKSEQNMVWVGLTKETAHQLGTPISSLMAWVEVLRETYPNDTLIPEMGRDVTRLQLIAERFSKIGSMPELKQTDLAQVVQHVVDYIKCRTSNKVEISADLPEGEMQVPLCAPLFEWVIENLCKNAIDAMDSKGSITITVAKEAYLYSIEVADTGKGIPQNRWKSVFLPGYTTKSRGWGLGLSLAKRIVEEYHRGSIFVKSSDPSVGTVFRIEINV